MAAVMFFDQEKARGFEQDCTVCRDPESAELRKEWGCDAPAPEEVYAVPCWNRHDTTSPAAIARCETCGDDGFVHVYRCPWSMIDRRHWFVCQVANNLEAGMQPFGDRGWTEWPATLVDAVGFVQRRAGDIRMAQLPGD